MKRLGGLAAATVIGWGQAHELKAEELKRPATLGEHRKDTHDGSRLLVREIDRLRKPETRDAARRFYREIYEDTRIGLEKMRDPVTGMVFDRLDFLPGGGEVKRKNFMPTNIGFDLTLLAADARRGDRLAPEKILKILTTLEGMPRIQIGQSRHFFNWYEVDPTAPQGYKMALQEASSIDSIHLAFGIWAAGREFAPGMPQREASERILKDMDFSVFFKDHYPFATNIIRLGKDGSLKELGKYEYHSETRSIVPLALALGLIQDPLIARNLARDYLEHRTRDRAIVEGVEVDREWDGGSFQKATPEVLYGESTGFGSKSESLSWDAMVSNTLRKHIEGGTAFPRAYSASQIASRFDPEFQRADGQGIEEYRGRLGHPEFISPTNQGDVASLTEFVAPYALMMEATRAPEAFVPGFRHLKELQTRNGPMYRKGWGFVDAIPVHGKHEGASVQVILALDNSFSALALEQILDRDGKPFGFRALEADPKAAEILREYYRLQDGILGFGSR